MIRLRLVADDLTGALDSAAQFTARIRPLPVLLDLGAPKPDGSYALDLACRDGDEAVAVARARTSLGCFEGADIAFKKIDSLLRGHWAAELAEIVRAGVFDRIVLAPAFPAQGRMTRHGRQWLRDATTGACSPIADPAAVLARRGVTVRMVDDGDEPGLGVLLLDATSDADLDAIVARHSDGRTTLWCGAAGLARAIAGHSAPQIEPGALPHLVLVGSHHPVTRLQLDALAAVRPGWLTRFDADSAASAARIATMLRTHGRCVARPDLPPGLNPADAAASIATWIGALGRHLDAPPALTVVGGETFAALCSGLGAACLTVEGDCEPGIPASRMKTGRWQGTICFSKSGAFGGARWLVEHLHAMDDGSGDPLPGAAAAR